MRATNGRAEVEGAPAGSAEARAAIGYPRSLFRFPEWLTADELLAPTRTSPGSERRRLERAERLELVGLGEDRDTKVMPCRRACSSGSGSRRR